jgi:ABC-2 type transport system permease protein
VIAITTQRELGVLERRRATPAPASMVIAGRALTALVVAAAVTAVVALLVAGCGSSHPASTSTSTPTATVELQP